MDKKVKSIEEFRRGGQRLSFSAMGGICIGTYVCIAVTALFGGVNGWIAPQFVTPLVFVPSILVGLGVFILLHVEKRLYEVYLSEFHSDVLVPAQGSPDLSEKSREAITDFLNEHHPGWSFDGSEGGGRQVGA